MLLQQRDGKQRKLHELERGWRNEGRIKTLRREMDKLDEAIVEREVKDYHK